MNETERDRRLSVQALRAKPLDRILRIFTPVEPGEGTIALLMCFNIFLILSAYYILKTVREGLLVGGRGFWGLSGPELKIYASAAMALLLLIIVPIYDRLASRVNRIALLSISMGAVIFSLMLLCFAARAGLAIGLIYFLWVGIISVFLIAQFWSFANDIYTEKQGARLFGFIALGASSGAIVGPKIADIGKNSIYVLMLLAGLILAASLALYHAIHRHARAHSARQRLANAEKMVDTAEKPLEAGSAFALIAKNPYLRLVAFMMLLTNVVNTTGEFILARGAQDYALAQYPATRGNCDETTMTQQRQRAVTGFYGAFYFRVNLIGFLMQAFLVSRILHHWGVRSALFFLPVVSLVAYTLIASLGGLILLQFAKTAENSVDYSLQNTVRQALFLPTSREAKYKAKAAIDTFFVRFGDAIAALMVALGTHFFYLATREFALMNILLIAVWIVICVGIARRYRAPDKPR